MRPTIAIIPLALLLSWFGPSPSGEAALTATFGMGNSAAREPSVSDAASAPVSEHTSRHAAETWATIQQSAFLRTASELPPRR